MTGTGYLRSKGWVMRISFVERIGGKSTLKALQTYTRMLDEKYGKKAFQRFSEADMQILSCTLQEDYHGHKHDCDEPTSKSCP